MNERTELNGMNDRELVAYFNILTANERVVCRVDPENKNGRHLAIVSDLLRDRKITFASGKRIK